MAGWGCREGSKGIVAQTQASNAIEEPAPLLNHPSTAISDPGVHRLIPPAHLTPRGTGTGAAPR